MDIKIDTTLDAKIAALQACGAHQYDPVRFRYITSMDERLQGKPPAVAEAMGRKAMAAIDAYESDLEGARRKAEAAFNRICAADPDKEPRARRLFETYAFQSLHRLERHLNSQTRESELAALTRQIGRHDSVQEDEASGRPRPDDLLHRQQQAAVAAADGSAGAGGPLETAAGTEMRSAGRFRDAMTAMHAERLVNRVAENRPENPGPLNAQMLASRSLPVLQQLSSAYLARFVSYIETLIWLEQAGEVQK